MNLEPFKSRPSTLGDGFGGVAGWTCLNSLADAFDGGIHQFVDALLDFGCDARRVKFGDALEGETQEEGLEERVDEEFSPQHRTGGILFPKFGENDVFAGIRRVCFLCMKHCGGEKRGKGARGR